MLQAGAGKAEIRYPKQFFPEEDFVGINDPIHVRALFIKAEIPFLLISMELPSIKPARILEEFREELGQKLNIPVSDIWICMTHDTSAPHVPPASVEYVHELTEKKKEMHLKAVKQAMLRAARKACGQAQPAVVSIQNGISYVNANRNVTSLDGCWNGIRKEGYSDRKLTTVRFFAENGTTICVLYQYAMKSAVMDGTRRPDGMQLITSDVTGYASKMAEKYFRAPVLFLMGAAGDQVPRQRAEVFEVGSSGHFRLVRDYYAGLQAVEELGKELANDVIRIAGQEAEREREPMRLIRFSQELPCEGQLNPRINYPVPEYKFVRDVYKTLKLEFVILGEWVMLGLQPELSAAIGEQIRKDSPYRHTMIVGMVNGGQGYLPQAACFEAVNYESLHSEFAKGSAEHMRNFVISELKKAKEDSTRKREEEYGSDN